MQLGIDLGTSGVRAVLLQGNRQIAANALPHAAPARWGAEALWAALVSVLRGLDLQTVQSLAVAGTSGTILATAADGTPLTRLSPYDEAAPSGTTAQILAVVPADSPAAGATSPLARAIAMLDVPGVHHVLHEADWITGRLCGRFDVTDDNNALKTGYDLASAQWPGWIEAAGMPIARLPQAVPAGTLLGPVSPAASAATGLPCSAMVVAGTTDGCASFMATGASSPGDAVTALGSTLTLKLMSRTPVTAAAYGIYSHGLAGHFLAGGASNTGGAVLASYFDPAQLAALSSRIDPARDTGLDYYPLLRPGERFPIADANLVPRLEPRPADPVAFLHGLLDGMARIEALGYRRLAEFGAPALTRVLTTGGGASNPAWTAIRTRHLGVPVKVMPLASAALGAALLARGC